MSGWRVTDATFAFGGMAATTVMAPKTAAAIIGQVWSEKALDAACRAVQEELFVAPTAPGGQPEYRGVLASSFLFKWFVAVSLRLEDKAKAAGLAKVPPSPLVSAAERSAATSWVTEPKPSMVGTQKYPTASYPGLEASKSPGITPPVDTLAAKAGGVRVVGESKPHAAGALHVSGLAEYTDDVPLPSTRKGPGLQGWLVRARKAPGAKRCSLPKTSICLDSHVPQLALICSDYQVY